MPNLWVDVDGRTSMAYLVFREWAVGRAHTRVRVAEFPGESGYLGFEQRL